MKIAIVGSGALGLYYGALLQKSGQDLHFLLRRDYEAISRKGLRVFSTSGDFFLPRVNGYRRPEEIGKADLIIVGLKSFANSRYEELLTPLVGEGTQILTLQNGLGNEERLAELFGSERIIGGIAFLCSNRGIPGEVHHLGVGRIVIGEYQPHDRQRLQVMAEMFRNAEVDCRITDDLRRARWEKLVWNIPFNGLSALLQQPVNLILAREEGRTLVREIMLEVITAANAQELSAPIDAGYADRMIELTDGMGPYRPSMLIDRENRRELETEAIFRIPLRFGSDKGVAMPRVEMLATLVEQVAGQ